MMDAAFYFLHLAVFCLVLFPFTALLFSAYNESYFRVPVRRRVLYACLAALGVLGAALYPLAALYLPGRYYLSGAVCLAVILFFVLIRDSFTKKAVVLFVSGFCIDAQMLLVFMFDLMKSLIADGGNSESVLPADPANVFLLFLGAALTVPALAAILRRVIKPYLAAVRRAVMWLEMALLALVDIVRVLLASFLAGMLSSMAEPSPWYVVPVVAVLILAEGALYFVVFRTSLARARESENRLQMELLRENAASLQREMEHSRDVDHDLRQLLRQLHTLSEGDRAELRPYIEKLVSLTAHTDMFFCENKCLNAVFQYYTGVAREKGIEIGISAACGNVPVEDADLTLLAANALENAIAGAEAYARETGKGAKISVVAGIVQSYLAMQFVNSCALAAYAPGVPAGSRSAFLPADSFVSTREGGGRGLKRIALLAEKYKGTAEFQYDGSKLLWTTRISLFIHGPVRWDTV